MRFETKAPGTQQIILIRHGRSAHVHTAGWVDYTGVNEWRRSYESSGVDPAEKVPAELQTILSDAATVVASDAPRAMESAALLAAGRTVQVSPLLRELALEPPRLFDLRLPLGAWAVAIGVRSLVVAMRRARSSHAEHERTWAAAEFLIELAQLHGTVAAVTHASFRRRLGGALERNGWALERRTGSWRHWSAWAFVRHVP